MPQVGEKGPGGKIWTGSDYGWQSSATIWKSQKPGGKVGETHTIPGGGTKVWTGKDYGWQTKATIDKTKRGSTPTPTPSPSPTPTPAPTPSPTPTPAPSPAPSTAKPTPTPSKPTSSASASTAEKIKGGLETYKKQVSAGDVKGAEATGKSTWALANPKLAAAAAERERTRGTSATTNPLMKDMKSKLPTAKESYDAFDIVLEYLISTGHADTISEASYLMLRMDSEMIQNIVEGVMPEPIDPVAHKAAQKTQKIYNLGKGTNNPNESQSALKRTGPQLPGV